MKRHNTIRATWLILICVGICAVISPLSNTQGARVVGGIKAGSTFQWDFNYTGTDYIGSGVVSFTNIKWFSLTVTQVENDGSFNLNYSDSGYRVRSPTINPNESLKMLPLGTGGSHSSVTTLTVSDIIAPLSMISVDWKEQQEYYIHDSTIITLPNRNVTHHTKYPFQGAWVDAYIFAGNVSQTHFGENLNGYYRLVYSAKHGFMIEYEVKLESVSSSSVMAFTAILADSNMEIGFSFFQNILVGFGASFGFQWIYSLILIGIIYARRRFGTSDYGADAKDEETSDENILSDEEGKIIAPAKDLPEDYNFIYECPFCGEEFEEYKHVCPECGGRR